MYTIPWRSIYSSVSERKTMKTMTKSEKRYCEVATRYMTESEKRYFQAAYRVGKFMDFYPCDTVMETAEGASVLMTKDSVPAAPANTALSLS